MSFDERDSRAYGVSLEKPTKVFKAKEKKGEIERSRLCQEFLQTAGVVVIRVNISRRFAVPGERRGLAHRKAACLSKGAGEMLQRNKNKNTDF